MTDYSLYKVPIFQGINDVPIAPTATKGGNISHFYSLYNQLIDDLLSTSNSATLESLISQTNGLAGAISNLNSQSDDLLARIAALEYLNGIYPSMPSNYTLEAIDITSSGRGYSFIESGAIERIIIANYTNAYDIFFSISGSVLTNTVTIEESYAEITFGSNIPFTTEDTFQVFVGSNTQLGVTVNIYLA
jgi:hypothetical protein